MEPLTIKKHSSPSHYKSKGQKFNPNFKLAYFQQISYIILPAYYEKKLFSCSLIFSQFDPHWKSLKNHIMWALWDRSPSQHWVLQVSRDTFCLKMGRNLGRNYKQPRQRSVSGWPGMTLRHFCETSANQTVSKAVSLLK